MLLLAASLFFMKPAPLEMPRAAAFVVRDHGEFRLEDRYDRQDLWLTRAVDGSWTDGDGREFTLASLRFKPPIAEATDPLTRSAYGKIEVPIVKKADNELFAAIDRLAPVVPTAEFARPRQLLRGYKDIRYYEGTNTTAIVCAYLPEQAEHWSLATWTLAEGDEPAVARELLEEEFLARRKSPVPPRPQAAVGERELLRADARHSVAAYANWHVTDGDTFTVLDNLPASESFRSTVTNELTRMRPIYALTLPSPVDGSNVLCVARLFASREEYLAALGMNGHEELEWSAAYWSPSRRELVAYLPANGATELVKTLRHEAFHQYLSYATAFISTSPWLNEGYAQYFETDEHPAVFTGEEAELYQEMIVPLLVMDYAAFYDGTDEIRALKYRLALSLAVFLEQGAPKVRFQPFKRVKSDYLSVLLETKDAQQATAVAFKNQDTLRLFTTEWVKFWKQH